MMCENHSHSFQWFLTRKVQIPSVTLSCPEDDVNLWSWCTFTFVQPILDLAMKKTLNDTDVWGLSPFFRHKNIFNKYLEYRAMYVCFCSIFILSLTTNMGTRYPTCSLFMFFLVSNSLDLILDILLSLWTAVVGKIVTISYVLVSISIMSLRFCASVCSPRNSIRPCLRCAGSKEQSLLLDFCYFHRPSFLCSSRSFKKLAFPKVLRTH